MTSTRPESVSWVWTVVKRDLIESGVSLDSAEVLMTPIPIIGVICIEWRVIKPSTDIASKFTGQAVLFRQGLIDNLTTIVYIYKQQVDFVW